MHVIVNKKTNENKKRRNKMAKCVNCGTEMAEGTKFCPNCGKPIEQVPPTIPIQQAPPVIKKKSTQISKKGCLIIFLVVVGIIILCAIVSAISNFIKNRDVSIKKVTGVRCTVCKKVFSADTTIIKMPKSQTDGKEFIFEYSDTLCEPCKEKVAAEAEKIYQEGRKAYNAKKYDEALQKFAKAKSKGHKKAEEWHNKTKEKRAKIAEAEQEEAKVKTRKTYEYLARAAFLDSGMDVKVRVHGTKNKTITLTFILIDAVWVHNFQKSEMYDEIFALGFRRINFKDGYDYSTYIKRD